MRNSAKYCSEKTNRIKWLYLAGLLFLGAAVVTGLMLGSTKVTFAEIRQAFTDGFDSSAGARIFAYVRLPRTAAALVCGAALAVSGAVIQGVLANRLASPSIIGVNSGAGLAVTVCTALGIYGGWQLSVFSFLGAFAAVMLVSLSSRKWGASRGTVILIGVAMNSLLGAVSDTIITFIPNVGVMSNDFKIGEFSAVTYQKLIPAALMILITVGVLLTLTNELDVLTLGEDNARGLGMNTSLMRTLFLLLAALLAGCAVSIAGLLSFVGLIVPHAVRRMAGSKSSHLVGLCALFGAAFVCLCDTISRTAFAPYEIPVGIIMAFLGAPFFVFILIKGKGGHAGD
ncbi:MAG: iron ABC transporter permease [Eubacteriales bacterium]|mgnify:CR=1 FL=1|nr:iron ABC transporter permease [Eubacteriales bacterium]MDY4898666.1 iron ABC transporter permease [Eubacteriales bacterium]